MIKHEAVFYRLRCTPNCGNVMQLICALMWECTLSVFVYCDWFKAVIYFRVIA